MLHSLYQTEVKAGNVAVHWFGQSSYALKGPSGQSVLIDPYFPHDRPAERYIHGEPPVSESALAFVDVVLLTHDHRDHTCVETLARLHQVAPNITYVGPKESVDHIVRDAGIPGASVRLVSAGDRLNLGRLEVTAVYAKPPAGDSEARIASPDVTHLGYVVNLDGVKLYFSGDPINTFADHEDLIEPVRTENPTIGFLTTHPTEGEFPFFDGSREMARKIGLEVAVPAHYDCFVKRTYDPAAWAEGFGAGDPKPLIIGYNETVIVGGA